MAVALPQQFVSTTRQLMGEERFQRFMAAFEVEPPVSIRLNPLRLDLQTVATADLRPVPWCPLGFYLDRRPTFTFDPLFHAGCYYVQEAASMFIHHVLSEERSVKSAAFLAPRAHLNVLDLCAAPGGKSTLLRSVLPAASTLYSNDPVPKRASILRENIEKWGYGNCVVTNNYPHDYVRAGLTFDIVLCDAPCSCEGLFRRDPQSIREWSPQQVERCQRLQRDIVSPAWQCLRPGGLLIYSTCTFNTRENEENVRWILDTFQAELLTIPTQPQWNITGSLLDGFHAPVYRFIPGITQSEGLFVAVVRKSTQETTHPQPRNNKTPSLNIVYDSRKPTQQPTATIDVDYATAIAYLCGQAITLPPEAPRGTVAVSFMGHRLGLVKNLGTRANNLYPKQWRIRTTHTPAAYTPLLTPTT